MSSLSKLIVILMEIYDSIKAWQLSRKKEDLKDAARESIESNDQRPLENQTGSASDSSSVYAGMFKRARKKTPRDMAD